MKCHNFSTKKTSCYTIVEKSFKYKTWKTKKELILCLEKYNLKQILFSENYSVDVVILVLVSKFTCIT